MYEEKIKVFLESFGERLTENHAQRIDKFRNDLCQEYSFDDTQVLDTMELLYLVFHEENTPENAEVAVNLLDRILKMEIKDGESSA